MLFDVNAIEESRVLTNRPRSVQILPETLAETRTITYNSLDKVACAAHQDVGETAKPVKGGEKLVRGLDSTVSGEHMSVRSLTGCDQAQENYGSVDVQLDRRDSLEGRRCIHHCWRRVDEMRRSSQLRQLPQRQTSRGL